VGNQLHHVCTTSRWNLIRIQPTADCRAIADSDGRLIGFVCLGVEARVPGLAEDLSVIDLGVGLDPALVGRGIGYQVLCPVIDWIDAHHQSRQQRAVIQAWNIRSLRVLTQLGFNKTGQLSVSQATGGVDYAILHRYPPTRR
jgi:ribosomal-protein-alanine N-acetyltransferase